MASTVVLTAVVKAEAPSTACYVRFNDGTELEFANLATLQEWARQPDTDLSLTRKLCVAYALGRSSDLSNIASVRNKDFTFDLTNNSPIRVQ
jgi:hypothetical protein